MWPWVVGVCAVVLVLALVGRLVSVKLAIGKAKAEHRAEDLEATLDHQAEAAVVSATPIVAGRPLVARLRRDRELIAKLRRVESETRGLYSDSSSPADGPDDGSGTD
jgi:hypothetical protein